MRTKMILKFPNTMIKTPITYELVKRYDLRINILKAEINYKLEGYLIFDIDGNSKNIAEALEYLDLIGVSADLVTNTIYIDSEKCVHCGLCTSVCSVRALSMDKTNWNLKYIEEKCVGCNRCISACPTRAITSPQW